jgi:hypothetical protein
MRMTHYFLAMVLCAIPALLAAAGTGIALGGGELHLSVGLFAAIFTVATHTLLILFMIVTGKVLKAAMQTRPLPQEFLTELNLFFAEKRAYPVSGLGAVSIVAVAVLGYAHRAFGVPPETHMLLGIAAVAFNLWALLLELRTLRENQDLLDRTALALNAIDREREARGEPEPEASAAPLSRWAWLFLAASAWLPYLYWGLIEWKGQFGRVAPLLPVLCGLASLGCIWTAAARRPPYAGKGAS